MVKYPFCGHIYVHVGMDVLQIYFINMAVCEALGYCKYCITLQ